MTPRVGSRQNDASGRFAPDDASGRFAPDDASGRFAPDEEGWAGGEPGGTLGEEGEHGGVEGEGLDGASDAAGASVAAEDGDGGGVLIAAEEPAAGRVEGEVARGFAAAGDALDEGERAVAGGDGEGD